MMKKNCVTILIVLIFGSNLYAQKKTVTVASELKKLHQVEELPGYIEQTKLLQVSSYDTTGGNDDGFSGDYSFIRKNPDSSLVIFEAEGNGVINRIWTPTPTEDTLDFYFGNEKSPSYSVKFSDLFSGEVAPFEEPLAGNEIGGFYNYFPIPFKDGCKIVIRGKKLEFYQIQYRTYPEEYEMEIFSGEISTEAKNELERLKRAWNNIADIESEIDKTTDTILKPGENLTLAQFFDKGGRILGITLENAKAFEGVNKQVDIKITWDNEDKPAVYMPVADFFGYAFGEVSMQSLLLGSRNNINYCYYPMPFDNSAKIELIYRPSEKPKNDDPIQIKSEVWASKKMRNPEEEGKFYTYWNKNINAPLGEPHTFLKGEGKGHYVGTILQTQGLEPGMTLFFEGDDVTTIDGEMRVHGTGSEDYFNGGWYALLNRWDRKISLPLHGALDYSLPYSRTGGYRLFISDKMPFDESIEHTIEHGPEENNKPVDYTSAAFYYAGSPVHKDQPEPANELTGTYIPDTFVLYPQLLKYSIAGKVSVEGEILSSPTGGQVRIILSEVPKGDYKLYADIEKWYEGAEISVWQRQKEVAESVSFYSEENRDENEVYFSDIELDDFRKTITIKFKEDEERSKIMVKRWILKRQQ
ncbi:glycoside hydrolase family 172 protein [Salegentibacter sp. T436]|uniref:glycoside hydrolase family 172 protein n=1 Tax=Salegentibacter sp. T436 TaxID=1729720 RepID=UPI00094A624F|nr:glycoside hydrolase family 172 protein [Salegentibacter sp. T436]APS40559.1 hypothetical protein AO058_17490 [Salegentibacter sp. T436]